MAIDPRTAAERAQQAAQEAAAAAKAAADAAEADQAAQAAGTTAVDTRAAGLATDALALDQSGRQILQDTEVTIGAVVAEDLVGAHDLAAVDDSRLAGMTRESLIDLPTIGSVGGGTAGLTGGLPELGSTFQSNSGPGYGKSMVSDGALDAALRSTPYYNDAGTPDAGGDAGSSGDSPDPIIGVREGNAIRFDPIEGVYYDDAGPQSGKEDTSTPSETHKGAAGTIDGGATKTGKSIGASIVDFFSDIFGGDDDAETDGGTDGGTTGSDGGTTPDAGEPVPDEGGSFDPPPGWEGRHDGLPEDLRIRGAVAGAKGQDPEGEDDDGLGAGPGDEVINPGSEGTVYDTTRRGTVDVIRAVDWVGQPAPDDDKKPLPAELGVIDPGPGPEVINPGSGDQANADAEASTANAYSTAASTTGNGAATDEERQEGDGMSAPADDGAPVDGGMVDEGVAHLPPADDGDDAAGRGRDFGQSQGKGHGRGHGDDADELE